MKTHITLTALALSLVLTAAPAGAQISCDEVTQANTDRVQKEQSKHDQAGADGGLDDIYEEASAAAGDQQSCMSDLARAMQGTVPGDFGGLEKIFQSKACEAVKSAQSRAGHSFSVNAPGVNLPAPQQQKQTQQAEPEPAPQLPETQPGKSLLDQALDSFGRS